MTTLIAYGTVEGQTGKIARHVADRIAAAGGDAVLFDTADDATPPPGFDGVDRVILAASVHERRHPRPFEVFLAASAAALADRPTLLVSVSLKAAFPEGREDAAEFVEELVSRTGVAPDRVALVAGAVRPSGYDWFASQILRHVVLRGHREVSPDETREFTDWDALDAEIDAFLAEPAHPA